MQILRQRPIVTAPSHLAHPTAVRFNRGGSQPAAVADAPAAAATSRRDLSRRRLHRSGKTARQCGELVTDFIVLQIVVGMYSTLFCYSTDALSVLLPRAFTSARVILRGLFIARRELARARVFQLIQQSVKIDRDNRGGTNGTGAAADNQPAGAEILPEAAGERAGVSRYLRCRAVKVAFGAGDIFNPDSGRGVYPDVLCSGQNATVFQRLDETRWFVAPLQCLNALHPVGVLPFCSCGRLFSAHRHLHVAPVTQP